VDNNGDRRPLTSRDTGWARKGTQWLTTTGLQPNQISMGSVVFAALAGLLFFIAPQTNGLLKAVLLILAALACQCRLLCNLFDGLLAVEAGRKTNDGIAWNEFPDRYADILILVGIGYGVGMPSLGWAAACFSVLTAYTRELGNTAGNGADFIGPMAKQHRMAVVTVAAVVGAFLVAYEPATTWVLTIALAVITLGAALTSVRRTKRLLDALNSENDTAT